VQVYVTDEELIKIYNIRNIESIKLTDLVQSYDNKRIIVPSLLVVYDNGKVLNLCSRDKYFDVFVKKVRQVYNDEKENILEDSLTDPFNMSRTIDIDDRTKKILDGELEFKNELYSFYENKKYYTESLIFEIDEVKMMLNIVKYHLKEMFSKTDITLNFNNQISGYKTNYVINGSINGVNTIFPLIYTKNDDEFIFEIGNIVDDVKIKIYFRNDRIVVSGFVNKYKLFYEDNYFVSTSVVKRVTQLFIDSKLINYENKDLIECQNDFLNLTYDTPNNLKWFKLPWGGLYGINNEIENISEFEKSTQIYNIYLDVFNDSFIRKEHFCKNYKRNDTVSLLGQTVVLDEVKSNTIGVKIDGRMYLIETMFDKVNRPCGFYKLKFENRYFYHVVRSNTPNIGGIKKEKFINISQDDDIFVKEDVLDNIKIRKLVRG